MKISIRCIGTATESTKRAPHDADIGEIQIAIHHIGDAVTYFPPAKLVRDSDQSHQVLALDGGQRQALLKTKVASSKRFFKRSGHCWSGGAQCAIPGNIVPIAIDLLI